MSNRIEKTFNKLKATQSKAFIPYTVLGYPNRQASLEAVETLIKNGATALELGLPFSDPMADGPLIENASKQVVESGFTTGDAIGLIQEIRMRHESIPIIVMTYFNLAMARGLDQFMQALRNAGVDGITFVDLPPEEGEEAFDLAKKNGLAPVMLVSQLTSEERFHEILKHAEGYLYLVSRAGITGLAETYDAKLETIINQLRLKSKLPVVIGFGISKPAHVCNMLRLGADGVVVGSKIVEMIGKESANDLANAMLELSSASRLNKNVNVLDLVTQ
ncbi:tryptophan synthase subunit alpha [Candidatus Obscuribacterales bacterium]|nr:tryptophan synthase subunit alpha [Candidatus Obscuribacterales bacterium]